MVMFIFLLKISSKIKIISTILLIVDGKIINNKIYEYFSHQFFQFSTSSMNKMNLLYPKNFSTNNFLCIFLKKTNPFIEQQLS